MLKYKNKILHMNLHPRLGFLYSSGRISKKSFFDMLLSCWVLSLALTSAALLQRVVELIPAVFWLRQGYTQNKFPPLLRLLVRFILVLWSATAHMVFLCKCTPPARSKLCFSSKLIGLTRSESLFFFNNQQETIIQNDDNIFTNLSYKMAKNCVQKFSKSTK